MQFVHLHVHSHYSILDGAAKIAELFKAAEKHNQPALALTDHGNMFGAKEFLDTAKKFPTVKPIVGCEFYIARGSRKEKRGRADLSGFHLVLLAKNLEGYKNLIKLSSYAYIDGFYSKPRIDRELLESYSNGIICTSACLAGEIPQAILAGKKDEAKEIALWYKTLFGSDFYLELQRHETSLPGANSLTFEEQQRVNKVLIELAQELEIKYVATNDVHFVSADDGEAHDRLICLNTNADFNDPNRLRYTKQEYLKSTEEMVEIFKDLPLAIENSLEIAAKIENYSIDSNPIMPHFAIPPNFKDSNHYLRELTYIGAKERYGELSEEYRERIDFELATIERMGYPDYFLIVQDFVEAARRMGVAVGPGRGSASGSVVAYTLKITNVDPMKYGLLFERFLSLDRVSLPDIDIDFDDAGRAKVIKYVEEKYGETNLARVVTFGTMKTKNAIRDMARIQGVPLSEADRLAKLVPERFPDDKDGKKVKVTMENCLRLVPELAEAYSSGTPLIKETLNYASKLEGTVRNIGVHASAIIVGRDDLREYIPISTALDKDSKERFWVSQFDGSLIESVGMLKMDFLGLKTLSIIKAALENISKTAGVDIDIEEIPLDDPSTYRLYSRGETIGTFQFESDGMRKWLKELKPNLFEDLIAMNALHRPGPMDHIADFVERKHGLKQIVYDLPVMKEVLASTYGVTVYQEQLMILSQKISNLTKVEADTLRRAISKKNREVMNNLKLKFIKGGIENGHPKESLEKIWTDWEAFAEYAFNKSHSTCYARLGYQTAYLKANYPAQYMAATLSNNLNDIKELTKLMDECRRMKVEVLGPDVNESIDTFTVNSEGKIRFGMAGIKGVGANAVDYIVKCREKDGPYISIIDFFERTSSSAVNRKSLEALIYAGAFDSFTEIQRQQFFTPTSKEIIYLDALIRYGTQFQADILSKGNSLFGDSVTIELTSPEPPALIEANSEELLKREKELIGIYLSAHPLDDYKFEMEHLANCSLIQAVAMASEAKENPSYQGKELILAGMISNVKLGYTKRGTPSASFSIEDFDGVANFALFGKDYEAFMQYFQSGLPLLLRCEIAPRYGFNRTEEAVEHELKIRKIRHLANSREEFFKRVTIQIPVDKVDAEFRKLLVNRLKKSKGGARLTVQVVDRENQVAVDYLSLKYQILVSRELFEFFDEHDIAYSFTPSLSF